jgi:hypothetical protein
VSSKRDSSSTWFEENWVYLAFLSLGVLLVALAIVFHQNDTLYQLLVNLAASVIVVVIIEYIWKTRGGDPITRSIVELKTIIRQIAELERAGIASITLKRDDPRDQWLSQLKTATQVDLMGFTLAAEFSNRREPMEAIKTAIEKNRCKVRVLTLCPADVGINHPEGNALKDRRITEEELLVNARGAQLRIDAALTNTWSQFKDFATAWPAAEVQNEAELVGYLHLGWTEKVWLYSNIIRIDGTIWYSPYFAAKRGGESPIVEVSGPRSPMFLLLQQEFEHVWGQANKYGQ